MERLIWAAAQRLAVLVGCALAVIGPLLVRDAVVRRGVVVADVLGGAAACLALLALAAIRRATPFFARSDEETSSLRGDPYRHNARIPDDPTESDRARATRRAAGALFALAVAAAFAVAAAASR